MSSLLTGINFLKISTSKQMITAAQRYNDSSIAAATAVSILSYCLDSMAEIALVVVATS